MAAYLVREGYDVCEAASGQEDPDSWRAWAPKVMVVDWMLPRGSGLDLVRAVRGAHQVPIIMVTARN